MISSLTPLPVLGVPVRSQMLAGVDSLLSIVQMPAGVPDRDLRHRPGRRDQRGALRRARCSRCTTPSSAQRLAAYREANADKVLAAKLPPAPKP